VVRGHVHGSTLRGYARQGSVQFDEDRGHGSSPSVGSLDWLPSFGLEYELWGALEPLSSRIGSVVHTLVIPDSVDLKCLFEPFAGQGSDS
jgi:hypothetical protein